MKTGSSFLIVILMLWAGCVDRVNLAITPSELPIIIDGLITDAPGPHTVKISRAFAVDGSFHSITDVSGATVVITDDSGAIDVLKETEAGIYITNTLQGVVGRTYTLSITTSDGQHLESEPESMVPAGTVDDIFFEFVKVINRDKQIEEEAFNIYINSTAAPGGSRRLRWKFDGTYIVKTNPELLTTIDPETLLPVPLACAEDCMCCLCWVPEKEEGPIIINNTHLDSDNLNRVFMKHIPINAKTFYQKYRVEITQMEVSQVVYDFYLAIRGQIENRSSLFQPPFFELKGNIHSTNSNDLVVGIFSAAAISKRSIYILQSDVPHVFYREEIIGDCRAVAPQATLEKPHFWQ